MCWFCRKMCVTDLTRSCVDMTLTSVIWVFDTFENNFRVMHKLEKYLVEIC